MSAGSSSLMRHASVAASMRVSICRCATCASACTPASVRPAPYNSKLRTPVTAAIARSISPATVRAFFWICHPL